MTNAATCGRCGGALSRHAPAGLCPRCLLESALGEAPSTEPGRSRREEAQTSTSQLSTLNPPPISQSLLTSAPTAEDTGGAAPGPPQRLGDYELLERLGHGGVGVVYKARQSSLNRIVALKMLPFGRFTRDDFVKRFKAEAEAAAQLHHPNIVAIHEVGELDGQHYFAMEYIQGPNLAEAVRDQPMPVNRAVRLTRTIAEAVHYAHQHAILHRDLKPSNVLLDALDQPHVTDFGLAKRLTNSKLETPNLELTLSGQTLGSPQYTPPELAEGRPRDVGPRSDVYSLGALLYHLLTGRPPFVGETVPAVLEQVVRCEPVSPRLLHPAVSRDLETICLKCLEKEPAKRYPTAQALADELNRFLHDEPIHARPVGRVEKAWRWCRRKPALAASLAALALAIVGGFIGVSTQWHRAEHQRARAELQSHRAEDNAANERRERYYASIAAADSHIRNGDIDVALNVLTNCPPELRHWEWGRLLYLCQQSLSTLRLTNSDNFDTVIVNADGTRVVEAPFMLFAAGRSVCRDVRTGQELFEIASGSNSVVAMTFSLDGTRLAAALQSGLIRIWNVQSGQESIGFSAPSHVHTLQFNQTGSRLAVVMDSGRGLILDATNGHALLTTPELGVEFRIGAVDPNGRFWVTMDEDGRVNVRDAKTGAAQFHFQSDPTQNVLTYRKRPSLFLSPDGTRLAANASAQSARVWDLTKGREILFIPSKILGGAFHPNGTLLALFSGGKTAELWDLATGEKSPVVPTHRQRLNFVGFDESGARLRTASTDGTVQTWPALPGRERLDHPYFVDSVAYRPDGKRCVTTQQDGLARVWDTTTGQELLSFRGNWNWLRAASYSPDGKRIVTGGADRQVRIFEGDTGRELLVSTGHTSAIRSAAFSPDGRKVATGSWDKTVRLWDAETGQELFALQGHSEPVRLVAFTPDGTKLISVAHDSKIHVWDTTTGRLLTTLAGGNRALAVGRDGRRVATGSSSGSIRLWDLANGELLDKWTARSAILVLDFSPDGKRLLALTGDVNGLLIPPNLEIWEVESGRQLLVLNEHSPVFAAKFSPDGQRILSGSLFARAARLWEAFPWDERAYPAQQAVLNPRSSRREEALSSTSRPSTLNTQPNSQSLVTSAATPLSERIQAYAADYWRARLAAEEQARKLPPRSPPGPLLFPQSAWPPRDANAERRLLDLSSFYNVPLHACWEVILSEIDYDEDLSSLPTGIVTLGDVPFDVRGIIRLAIAPNSALDGSVFIPYPEVVEGIQVSANCRRIHVLHGTDLTSLPDGTPIWRIVLRYIDGQRREIPVLYGRDVRIIWELDQDTKPEDQGVVAWRGISPAVARRNGQQRLYRTTFNNPLPEVEVQSIDLVSAQTQCAPLVIAITIEP